LQFQASKIPKSQFQVESIFISLRIA